MSRLALTLTPSPYEPATSFASRLAQRNGHGRVQDFVLDMGLDWQGLVAGHRPEIVELATIAGVDAGPLLHFSPVLGEGKRLTLASEVFPHKSFETKALDICPLCMAEALNTSWRHLNAGARAWWPLRYARACDEHGTRLLRLPAPGGGRHKHDYAGRVRDCASLINLAAKASAPAEPQPFDRYFTDRLTRRRKRSSSWLDEIELSVVGQVCETLGLLLLDGPKSRPTGKDEDHLARATNHGFAALVGGRETLWPALEGVIRRSAAARGGPNADFPHLHGLLTRLPTTPGSELLRGELRAFSSEHYPLGPGDTVYGVPVIRRRLHSPSTIAAEIEQPACRVMRLMRDFQQLGPPGDLPPPDCRLQVPVEPWKDWLVVYKRSLTAGDAGDRLGVCRDFFYRLEEAGWISPFFEFSGHRTRYDPHAIDLLPKRFLDCCTAVADHPPGYLPLFDIASSCQIGLVDVLRSVEEASCVSGTKLPRAKTLQDIHVDREAVLDAFEGPPIPGLTVEEARSHLRVGTITLYWLIREGLLPVTKVIHPRTRVLVNRFAEDVVQAFDDRFRTAGQIAAEKQVSVRGLLFQLRKLGVPHLSVPPKVTPIYRIADLPDAYR